MNFVGKRRSERTKSDDDLVKSKLMLKKMYYFWYEKKKSSFHCLGVPIVKKFIKGINYELVDLLNLK